MTLQPRIGSHHVQVPNVMQQRNRTNRTLTHRTTPIFEDDEVRIHSLARPHKFNSIFQCTITKCLTDSQLWKDISKYQSHNVTIVLLPWQYTDATNEPFPAKPLRVRSYNLVHCVNFQWTIFFINITKTLSQLLSILVIRISCILVRMNPK